MTAASWQALKLQVAQLVAEQRMRAEAAQAQRDAATIRELARRRVTRPISTWDESARSTWARHDEIRKSLKALRAEAPRNPRCNTSAQHRRAVTSPATAFCAICGGAVQ